MVAGSEDPRGRTTRLRPGCRLQEKEMQPRGHSLEDPGHSCPVCPHPTETGSEPPPACKDRDSLTVLILETLGDPDRLPSCPSLLSGPGAPWEVRVPPCPEQDTSFAAPHASPAEGPRGPRAGWARGQGPDRGQGGPRPHPAPQFWGPVKLVWKHGEAPTSRQPL